MKMDKNGQYLTVLKGLLIILVVLGHFGQTITNLLPNDIAFIGHGLILYIYIFHMPLFVFVSGYLSKNVEKRRRNAFEGLFIPYFIFQVFVGLCILVLTGSWEAFYNIFIPQIGSWYLLALFLWRLLVPELVRVRHIKLVSVVLTIITCLFVDVGTEFALNKLLGFFVYFMAGLFCLVVFSTKIYRKIFNGGIKFITKTITRKE